MARQMHKYVLAITAQGRIQGEAKEVTGGKGPLLQKTPSDRIGYSNKPNSKAMIWKHVL